MAIIILSVLASLFGYVIPLFIHRTVNKHEQNPQDITPLEMNKLRAIPTFGYFVITAVLSFLAVIPLVIYGSDDLLTGILLLVFTLGPVASALYFSMLDGKISELETCSEKNAKNSEHCNVKQSNPTVHGWIKGLYNAEQ